MRKKNIFCLLLSRWVVLSRCWRILPRPFAACSVAFRPIPSRKWPACSNGADHSRRGFIQEKPPRIRALCFSVYERIRQSAGALCRGGSSQREAQSSFRAHGARGIPVISASRERLVDRDGRTNRQFL